MENSRWSMTITNQKRFELKDKNILSTVSYLPLLIFRYFLTYVSYNLFIWIIITCIFFVLFTLINLTGGDLRLIEADKIANLIENYGIVAKESFDQKDLIKFINLSSLILTIINIIISKIFVLTAKRNIIVKTKTKFLIGTGIITLFMLFALISIYFPHAGRGAINICPIILLFWAVSLFCYLVYSIIRALILKLENI